MILKNNILLHSRQIILTALITATMTASFAQSQATEQAQAQERYTQSKIDSLAALLPQMHGGEKLKALRTLCDLTEDLPEQKQYIEMYLDEARRQSNVEDEGDALLSLSTFYYSRFDTDTFFVVTDEAIRFARRHQLYEN